MSGRRVEQVVFALSLVIVLGSVGFLVYDGLMAREEQAGLEVTVGKSVRDGDAWTVELSVENNGDLSLADVLLQVEVGEGQANAHDVLLDYVPQGSTKTVSVIVQEDPAQVPVRARAVSYTTE